MLTIRELQELRQIQDNRKALTERYGTDVFSPFSKQTQQYKLNAWDPLTNKPQTLIQNTGMDPVVLDYNTPRQDITKKIVYQKPFPQQPPVKQEVQKIIERPILQQSGPLPQNIMHEYHYRERTYQLKSKEEILRPWIAKEIMYKRQIEQLQNQINRGGYFTQNRQTLQVKNVPKKLQLQSEIEKLEAILKNKSDEITRLKILSQELQSQEETLQVQSTTEFAKQEKEIEEWKKKFKDLNNLFHECQEECTMKETEIESIKNRKVSVIKQQSVMTKGKVQKQNMDSPRAIQSTVSDKDSDYY